MKTETLEAMDGKLFRRLELVETLMATGGDTTRVVRSVTTFVGPVFDTQREVIYDDI